MFSPALMSPEGRDCSNLLFLGRTVKRLLADPGFGVNSIGLLVGVTSYWLLCTNIFMLPFNLVAAALM